MKSKNRSSVWFGHSVVLPVVASACLFLSLNASARAQSGPSVDVSPEAAEIHESGMLFDGHNDLPFAVRMKGGSSFKNLDIAKPTQLHTDIPRLRSGGLKAQFWSVFVPASTGRTGNALLMTLEQIQLVHDMCEAYPDVFEMADTAADVRRITKEGKIASMIGVEGGHSIENSLQVLRMLYEKGARYMTLTHSQTLAWADSATDDPKNNGLSPFGQEVVREMNRIGMLVDLSHVSVKCMHDALDTTLAPVIFSHSSALAINDHPRNVPDEILKRTAENGGVVMVNFYSGYVVPTDELAENGQARGTLQTVCDHIEHIVKVAGIDHVGIGSDYDGVGRLPKGLDDVSCYPNISQELLDRGFSKADIHKVLGGNVLRVLEQAEQVSAKLKSGRLTFPVAVDNQQESLFQVTIKPADSQDGPAFVSQEIQLPEQDYPDVVSLVDGQGNALLAQLRKLSDGGGDNSYLIEMVVPRMEGDQPIQFEAKSTGLNPNRVFRWQVNEHSDRLTLGDQPVVEFMREPLDESSEERRAETYKPYHHVYATNGDQRLTKGPGGLFPHHRGIYFGYNRISYGDKTADTWHCKNGAYQSFEKNLQLTGGPVAATHVSEILWRGQDGEPFAKEIRKLIVARLGDGHLIDVTSTVTNLVDVKIDFKGDPQHAGIQFRATQLVPDQTAEMTYYIRPDGADKPGKFRNWSDKKNETEVNKQHVDLDFNALCFALPAQRENAEGEFDRWTIGYFPHADNPGQERFSERNYGRFGCYFETELEPGKSFDAGYGFLVKPGEMKLKQLEQFRKMLSNPPEVSVVR